MSKVMVMAGQSGVGKDFLLSRAQPESIGVTNANWGQIFADVAHEGDRDLMTYRPNEDRTAVIQKEVTRRVLGLQPVVVTSHPVKIENGIEYVNWGIEKELDPEAYVFVRAEPHEILARVKQRNASGERKTPELSIDGIARMQARKQELIIDLAHFVGSRLTIIDNSDDNTDESVAQLRELIEELADARVTEEAL